MNVPKERVSISLLRCQIAYTLVTNNTFLPMIDLVAGE